MAANEKSLKELQQKQEEILRLKAQRQGLRSDLSIIQEKLEQTQERIAIRNNELNTRKRKLKDLRKNSERIRGNESEEKKEKLEEDNPQILEKELKEKILKIISNRNDGEIDANELFYFDGQKTEVKSNMVIHTVKVKLVQSHGQSSKNSLIKIVPKEATFRIDKRMTFELLRKHACNHWVIFTQMLNFLEYSLYSISFTPLDGVTGIAIETYFNKNNIFPEVWLIEKTPLTSAYVSKPDQYIDDPAAIKSNSKSIKAQNSTKAQQELERFKDTLEDYHHLKYYLPPVNQNADEAEAKRQHGRDTSCCAILFILLLLLTSVLVIDARRNIEQEYWLRTRVYDALLPDVFFSIADPTTATNWMKNALGSSLFQADTHNNLLQAYDLVGPLVIRQVRSKQKNCLRSDLGFSESFKCYYFNSEGSEAYTDLIGAGLETWRVFNSSTGYKLTYNGEFGTYDTNGYLQEFKNLTARQFNDTLDEILSKTWLASATRALFISANLYQPSYDMWVIVSVVIEINTNRFAYPSRFDITTVQPNIFSRSPGATTADIFRIIFSLYIIYIYTASILEVKDGHRNIKHAVSFQGIMDLLLVVMVIFSVAVSLWINKSEKDIYTRNVFEDLSALSSYYVLYHNANTMTLTLIIVRVMLFLTVNKRIYVMIVMIEHSAKHIVSFVLIITALLLAFTMIAQSLWGIQELSFHSVIYCVVNLLLLASGHGKYEIMIKISEQWTALFLITYFLTFIFFLFSTFMGIFAESYRIVRMQDGYLDDNTTWTKNDILMWFVDWLPHNVKRRIFDKDKPGKRQEEEEVVDDDEEDVPQEKE